MIQPGILEEETKLARYLEFSINSESSVKDQLTSFLQQIDISGLVLGIGQPLVDALGKNVPGLALMPSRQENDINIPSSPVALWCWLRGSDRGHLLHQSMSIQKILTPAFSLINATDAFQYDESRDLSGYIDGTENPEGEDALQAAAVHNQGEGLDGSSFVCVQKWLHNFSELDAMSEKQKDDVIGRHHSDNEEFDEAPESAHVKRSAQESFEPEAFMLRRSMPWAEGMNAGLVFVAFGKSFDAFEAVLNRMIGTEDGITDALFSFTQPISGAYFWCPPIKDGKLDLSRIGL